MEFITVPNLEKWQHYKDRCPPWIKLHRDILNDYKYSCLQDDSKLHLLMIWLLASQMDNLIPYDEKWISKKINATNKINLKLLIERGFISTASEVIADCKQLVIAETETETETETEKEGQLKLSIDEESSNLNCPHKEIINLYHQKLPNLRKVKAWSGARMKMLAARWKEENERQDIKWWADYFAEVSKSDFLNGKTENPFYADLEWLIRPNNLVKVIEGKYKNKKSDFETNGKKCSSKCFNYQSCKRLNKLKIGENCGGFNSN